MSGVSGFILIISAAKTDSPNPSTGSGALEGISPGHAKAATSRHDKRLRINQLEQKT
jgi:hypothetical protein